MKVKQLAHVVLYVSDIDVSKAWYRDMFDMEGKLASTATLPHMRQHALCRYKPL